MAVVHLTYPKFRAFTSSNVPLSGGKLYVYAAGTSDAVDTYTDINAGTANANPVILDANGEAEIWYNQSVKLVLKDSSDVQLWSMDNVQANIEPTVTGNHNLVQNGSFEVDTNGDTYPDNWTLTPDTNGTIAIDSTSGGHVHGANGLKFTSGGSGGGAAVTTPYIQCLASTAVQVTFSLKSSAADNTNIVTVLWYQDENGTAASTASTAVYNDSATNPTSWALKSYSATAPADAYFCKIKLEGVSSAGTVTSGRNTIYDDVRVYQGPVVFPNITTPPLLNDTEIAILDGATVTTAELNILDGVTSTAAELNLNDGSVAGTIVNNKAVIYGAAGEVNATTLQIAGTSITATAAELNYADGPNAANKFLLLNGGGTADWTELPFKIDFIASATTSITAASTQDRTHALSNVTQVYGYMVSAYGSVDENYTIVAKDEDGLIQTFVGAGSAATFSEPSAPSAGNVVFRFLNNSGSNQQVAYYAVIVGI